MEEDEEVDSVNNLEVAELENETTETNEETDSENEVQEDSEVVDEKQEEPNTKIQSKEEQKVARDVRLRAETEYKERLERETKQAYEKGLNEAITKSYIGKTNPYTGKIVKDNFDIEEYQEMVEIDKAGGDPINDYTEKVKEKARAESVEKEKVNQRKTQEEKDKQDVNDFVKKYPDVNLSEMIKDSKFSKFIKGKLGNEPLTEIYEDYNELLGNFNTQAETKAKKIIANTKASPGSLGNGKSAEFDFDNMSDEDFEKIDKKILKGEVKFKR
ncbi:MAG: hypothetical protein RR290_00680 [Clostridia bacterium]